MDIKLIFTCGVLAILAACGTKKEDAAENGIPISITINNALPHCGGAAPMPDDVWPKVEICMDCSLSVHKINKDGSRGKQVTTFVHEDGGRVDLKLPKGKYQLWSINKLEDFHRFMELESEPIGIHYEYKDESCFKEWFDRADFSFEVIEKPVGEKSDFSFVYKNRCFIGSHPCMIYSGPYPP